MEANLQTNTADRLIFITQQSKYRFDYMNFATQYSTGSSIKKKFF